MLSASDNSPDGHAVAFVLVLMLNCITLGHHYLSQTVTKSGASLALPNALDMFFSTYFAHSQAIKGTVM